METTSSAYSEQSTAIHDFQNTPEWQEYRASIATSNTTGVAERVLTPGRTISTSDVDSENVETEPDRSSTEGIFYRKKQTPVDAVDTLQIIEDNLKILKREDFTREYHQVYDKACWHLTKVIQLLDNLPREVNDSVPYTTKFAEFLIYQSRYLRSKIISPTNLADPDLYRDIEKFHSNLQARKLHNKFQHKRGV